MTPWREWLRASPLRTACFLIAVLCVIRFQGNLAEWLWFAWRGTETRPELASLETNSWPWLRESVVALIDASRWTIGWQVFGTLAGIGTCFAATMWLHATSWKDTWAKLGLPKPRRVEFTIPMIACIPGFAFVVLVLWPQVEPSADDRDVFLSMNIVGILVAAFGRIITLGFLYRGLVVDARWKLKSAVLLLLVIGVLPGALLLTLPAGHDVPFSVRLEVLALGVISLTLAVWIFHYWRQRLWSLVALAIGTSITIKCIPFGGNEHYGKYVYVLGFLPYWFLIIWTWVSLRAERMKVATKNRRCQA